MRTICALSLLASVSADAPVARNALVLRGGAGPTMPQTVLAVSGSALSLSGLATLVDARWLEAEPVRGRRERKKRLSKKEKAAARSPPLSRLASGLLLVGWGVAKLGAARLLAPALQLSFCRVNVPAVLGLLSLQLKRGRAGFLPFEVQAGLASLYAAVALGVTKIPRPGNDRFPDRFLEYLPPSAKLHLV